MVALALHLLIFDPVTPRPALRLVGDLFLEGPAPIEHVQLQPPPPPPSGPAPQAAERGDPVATGTLVCLLARLGSAVLFLSNVGLCFDQCTRQTSEGLAWLGAFLYFIGTPSSRRSPSTGRRRRPAGIAAATVVAVLVHFLATAISLLIALVNPILGIVAFGAAAWATSRVAARALEYGPPTVPAAPAGASRARPEIPAPQGMPVPFAAAPLLSGTW